LGPSHSHLGSAARQIFPPSNVRGELLYRDVDPHLTRTKAMTTVLGDLLFRHVRKLAAKRGHDLAADRDLLERFATRHDADAFEILLERHGPMVLRVCRRMLNEHDAEDVFQATFLVLARKAASIRKRQSAASWLYGVAYRLTLKARAAAGRRRASEEQRSRRPAHDPLDELTVREGQAILDEELARLPERLQAPLILCYMEGRTRDEAARQLGWPPALVKSRLEQARDTLRWRLARRGLSLPTALSAALLADGAAPAAVPMSLSAAALRIAVPSLTTSTAPAVVPAQVADLAVYGLKSTLGTKLKIVAALLVMTAALGASVGRAIWLAPSDEPADSPQSRKDEPGFRAQGVARSTASPHGRTDRHGDALPEGALARLGTVRFRLGNGISGMALAPDGKTAVSVGGNGLLQFWEIPTGKERRRIEWERGGGGRVVAYSPDSRLVASVRDPAQLHLWEAGTGQELAQLGLPMQFIQCLAFSPDGNTLAAGGGRYSLGAQPVSDSVVGLWKWDGANLQRLWEARPDHEARVQGGKFQAIRCLAFSPDGRHLTTGGLKTGSVRIWDVAGGRELRQMTTSSKEVGAVAFAPNGKVLLSGSDDGVIAFWDPETGTKLREARQPGEVAALAFAPNGRLLAAGGGPGTSFGSRKGKTNQPFLLFLDPATGLETRRLADVRDGVASLAFSQDGSMIAAGLGGTIRLWNPTTGNEVSVAGGHHHWISAGEISEDGNLAVTAGGDGTVILWDLATGTEKQRLLGHDGEARAAVFVPGGKFVASAATDHTIRLWDLATGRQVRQLEGSLQGLIYSLVVSADGKNLAAGDYHDGTVRLWDLATGNQVHSVKVGDQLGAGVMCLAFAPNGRMLAVAETALNAMKLQARAVAGEARIQLWDVETGLMCRQFLARPYCITSISFSPDGRLLASTGWRDKVIRLWDVSTGKKLHELPCGTGSGAVRFSPDGKTLAWGNCPEGIFFWEMTSKQRRRRFQGHAAFIHSLAFSPDGRTLLSGSMDTTALVWDLTGGLDRPKSRLSREQCLSLWEALASPNAEHAGRAIWSFTADPHQAVPCLAERMRHLPVGSGQQIAKLIADLDSDTFFIRDTAQNKLEKLGPLAEQALRDRLARNPSLEARRRIEQALEKREAPIQSAEVLRVARAIEALESIATPEALQALKDTARQCSEAYLKREAQASCDRLAKRLAKLGSSP
jgi:RNA polymerase sigma factor (sigma-70 family)